MNWNEHVQFEASNGYSPVFCFQHSSLSFLFRSENLNQPALLQQKHYAEEGESSNEY